MQLPIFQVRIPELVVVTIPVEPHEAGELLLGEVGSSTWGGRCSACGLFGLLHDLRQIDIGDLADQARWTSVRGVAENRSRKVLVREARHIRTVAGITTSVIHG